MEFVAAIINVNSRWGCSSISPLMSENQTQQTNTTDMMNACDEDDEPGDYMFLQVWQIRNTTASVDT